MFKICFAIVFSFVALSSLAQPTEPPGKFWQSTGRIGKNHAPSEAWVQPGKAHAFDIDHAKLAGALKKAPKELSAAARIALAEIELPMPDGTSARFNFVESSIMEPELAAKFPELKTYVGQGVDDPSASVRFDVTPEGLHAQILSPKGAVYIDPLWRSDRISHSSYYKRDYKKGADGFQCLVGEQLQAAPALGREETVLSRSGGNLRTYRLACAATGEYVAFHGGTVSSGMSAIVTAINRINGVYEIEVAVRLVLVANNNLLVFTNAVTDPYNNSNGSTMLGQNQTTVDSVIGAANYDIGHVFSTGGGGVALLGCVCRAGLKAQGVTGKTSPIGDPFYIDYVAHEMGHQFGGNHTFNSEAGNCGGGNRNASTAYEPGSGTTIQAYAGICSTDDLQSNSDPYFHSISFDEIITYTTTGLGNGCPAITATGNSVPTVSAGANFTIPRSTPFTLTASGSDPNGDPLTFCWEERDLGAAQTLSASDNGSSPLFRSFNPTTNASRTFPKLSALLSNSSSLGEKLPTLSRTMNFRVTARDNRAGGGGVNTANMSVTVNSSAGPFVVTSPNTNVSWSGVHTVTWNVANTTASPVNAANVNILLSTDGGNSFPTVLLANTPNDGSESVLLPNVTTSTARIKVEAAGNIFFDISDANFSISPAPIGPFVTLASATLTNESCAPGNNSIDPNELVSVSFSLQNGGTANTANLVVTLLATNGVTSPSGAQNYGTLIMGGSAVARTFSFVASGSCGGTILPTLQLQDGTNNLGTVETSFVLGSIGSVTLTNTNATSISIPNSGKATPYPSSITISNRAGTITKATVSLLNFGHTFPSDIDILLVGPSNKTVLLFSAAGGSVSVNNINLTFDSSAASALPQNSQIFSGTYLPSNYGPGATLSSPAPTAPYGSTLNIFNDMSANGTWSLYVEDQSAPDKGNISGGWKLNLTTTTFNCCVGNSPPIISSISNQTTAEDTATAAIPFTVSDIETPAASLVVFGTSSNTNLVPNTNLVFSGSGSNRFLTITPATNQFGTATITVFVSDGAITNSTSFLLTVNAVNDAPVLTAISAKVVNEETLLIFTNTATDVETNQLTFSLDPGAPIGAAVHPTTGVFSWTPTEAQGPNVYSITVRVTDNGSPNLSDAKTFSVTVNEVNLAPSLAAISNRVIYLGNTLIFTNTATDADLPTNSLSFSFDQTVSGATVGPNSAVFSWTPATNQIGTNNFILRVTDNGVPNLHDTKAFAVVVVTAPVIQSVTQTNGTVTLVWSAVAGQNYRVQFKNNLNESAWSNLAGDVTAASNNASKTDSGGLATERYYRILVLP